MVFTALSVTARADEFGSEDLDVLADLSAWIDDVKTSFVVRSDPIFRQIICQIPYANRTLPALAAVTGISPPTLKAHVVALGRIGLLAWVHDWLGHLLIVPANESARAKMSQWADEMCVSGEDCGIGP